MATRAQMEATYNYMDEMFRLTFGEAADITWALYNGDFSKSLEQAQRDKHEYVLDALCFREGSRLLDIGCGWGPILMAARQRGGNAVGVTLSTKHAESCRHEGLDAWVLDWKDMSVETFGPFMGVVSIGAFEHFCSVEEYQAGKQDQIYDHFFRLSRELLPGGGRLYLQTMMWGPRFPGVQPIRLDAPHGSDEHILAVLGKFYPGSFLPLGEDQLVRIAAPYFRLISDNNGRRDYIETTEQWSRVWRLTPAKVWAGLKLAPYLVTDPDFRYRLETLRGGYMKECLKREIMDHQRLVFEAT
jgi:cyclopropane-fatty-acyl-phospholipid synthase